MHNFLEMIGFFTCFIVSGGLIVGCIYTVINVFQNRDGLDDLKRSLEGAFADKWEVNSLSDRVLSLEKEVFKAAAPKGKQS